MRAGACISAAPLRMPEGTTYPNCVSTKILSRCPGSSSAVQQEPLHCVPQGRNPGGLANAGWDYMADPGAGKPVRGPPVRIRSAKAGCLAVPCCGSTDDWLPSQTAGTPALRPSGAIQVSLQMQVGITWLKPNGPDHWFGSARASGEDLAAPCCLLTNDGFLRANAVVDYIALGARGCGFESRPVLDDGPVAQR